MKQKLMLRFQEDEVILRLGNTPQEMYNILSGKAADSLHYGMAKEYLFGI